LTSASAGNLREIWAGLPTEAPLARKVEATAGIEPGVHGFAVLMPALFSLN
jgi:hypothetical protein